MTLVDLDDALFSTINTLVPSGMYTYQWETNNPALTYITPGGGRQRTVYYTHAFVPAMPATG